MSKFWIILLIFIIICLIGYKTGAAEEFTIIKKIDFYTIHSSDLLSVKEKKIIYYNI